MNRLCAIHSRNFLKAWSAVLVNFTLKVKPDREDKI